MTVIQYEGDAMDLVSSKEQERDFFESEGFRIDFIDLDVSDILLFGERFQVSERTIKTEELLLKNIVQVYFSLEYPYEEKVYKELEDVNVFRPGSSFSLFDKGLVIGYIRYVIDLLDSFQIRYNLKRMIYLNSIDVGNIFNYRLTLSNTYGFYYRDLEILENGKKYLYFGIVHTKEVLHE